MLIYSVIKKYIIETFFFTYFIIFIYKLDFLLFCVSDQKVSGVTIYFLGNNNLILKKITHFVKIIRFLLMTLSHIYK